MRVTKIICNKCHYEIEGSPVQLVPALTDRVSGGIIPGDAPHMLEQMDKDYCPGCVTKIIAFANGMAENPDFKAAVEEMEQGAVIVDNPKWEPPVNKPEKKPKPTGGGVNKEQKLILERYWLSRMQNGQSRK